MKSFELLNDPEALARGAELMRLYSAVATNCEPFYPFESQITDLLEAAEVTAKNVQQLPPERRAELGTSVIDAYFRSEEMIHQGWGATLAIEDYLREHSNARIMVEAIDSARRPIQVSGYTLRSGPDKISGFITPQLVSSLPVLRVARHRNANSLRTKYVVDMADIVTGAALVKIGIEGL